MKRRFLAAAVALSPLVAICGAAQAKTTISTATTTPVATATANNGAPDDVDIASGGSITPANANAPAVTLNSNNTVTNEGAIDFKDVDNAVGVLIEGGDTGQFTSTGSISITESYTATDTNSDGLLDGAFAKGAGRIGIEVAGPGVFTGGITTTGGITIQGNNSDGILINAPITGDLLMLTVTPPTTTGGQATPVRGTISITGDNSVGVMVGAGGGIGGNVKLTSVNALGVGSQAVVIDGAVAGGINISGAITATGYRSTARPTIPSLALLYTAEEMQQGGSALVVGANVGKGVLISAPPLPITSTTQDADGDGVPDAVQGTGSVNSFGAAPAIQIGSKTQTVELGEVGTGANGYGLVIQGAVSANGVFDPLITPNLPAVVPATAIQIGGVGNAAVTIDGGVHSTGSILATAYQADATGIHVGAGATIPTILNDGTLAASSTQINSATTATGTSPVIPAPLPVTVSGILIDQGATVTSIVNNLTISASISGTGGVGGAAQAIVDRSGTLASVVNSGGIVASLNQTLITALMPGTLTAIDMSAGTGPQSITQMLNPAVVGVAAYSSTSAYAIGDKAVENDEAFIAIAAATAGQSPVTNPSLWKAIGTTNPAITGSIFFGNGGSTLEVDAGVVTASTIEMGSGANTLTVNGDANTIVTGAVRDEGNHTLAVNVVGGTLSDTNPNTILARSVNVGATGILIVSADPFNHTNTDFVVTGASNFAQGAQVGLTLASLQADPTHTYTIVETVPGQGTLTAGTFGTTPLTNAPFLYSAQAAFVAAANPATGPSEIQLTVTRKSPAQLGFNNAEGSAFEAVLAALPADTNIEKVVLAQTTEAGLKAAYDQLLPDQGQGIFDALDSAAQAISSMTGTTPDAGTRVAGSSLWLQEVNEQVDRKGIDTLGSKAKLFGVVGGYERMGAAGGALGVTLAYMNTQETDDAAAVNEHVVASTVEGSLYYRRAAGPLTVSARGGLGYAWFSDDRRFVAPGAINVAFSNWGAWFMDAHFGAAYEQKFGRFYARPELSADYLRLNEGGHGETGGGPGFDLTIASRNSSRLSGQAIMVLGREWGRGAWLRSEVRAGYREIFSGQVGDTVANFAGGDPFSLAADNDKGGWLTVGFSLKSGTQFSYLAIEGDADLRNGEQRYDLRVAGRSMF